MTSYLVTGSDPSLVSRALSGLLEELGGGGPVAELEEYDAEAAAPGEVEETSRFDLSPVLSALATPSWLSERRVVVLRGAGGLVAAQAAELAKVVAAPATDNVLVLAGGGRSVPQSLLKAVKAAGGRIIETDPGRGSRARTEWLEAHLARSPVHLDATARRRLVEHIGEDAARLDPILELAEATYGAGRKLGASDLEPLLGEEGSAPPWELTDAIDAGDGARAIHVLHRLLGAGDRHPLQVLATLNRHVSSLLRLDGAERVRSAEEAASVLQVSAFPARKLLEQARRLGHDRIVRAVEVVAQADADLRGRLAWPAELVIEVAVARLAQLSRSSARPAPSRR